MVPYAYTHPVAKFGLGFIEIIFFVYIILMRARRLCSLADIASGSITPDELFELDKLHACL